MRTLTDYFGSVIPVVGCLDAFICVQGKSCPTLLYIVERSSALIGVDVVRGTGLDLNQVLEVKAERATVPKEESYQVYASD